jgi:hypothetical protein
MSSEMLLAICAAVGVGLDLLFRLIAHIDDLRISVRPRVFFAKTTTGAEGIRVLIRNHGQYPANIDWLRIESSAASLCLPLHDRLPIARGASDTCALALQDLLLAGIRRGDSIRVRVVLDLGHDFPSAWIRIPEQVTLARIVSPTASGDAA